jgi:hypothetical protein
LGIASTAWVWKLDTCWHSDRERAGRNVAQDDGIGPDDSVIANVNMPEYFGSGAQVDAVADDWGAGHPGPAKAQRHAMAQGYIIADHRIAADDNAAKVLDDQSPAYLNLAGQIDTGDNLHNDFERPINN